jgi:hypothetical protein
MATLVWGIEGDILEADEKLGVWGEEKGREGAAEENGFLCAAVVGLGFCWKADVTATESVRLERKGVRSGRRKVEENSLKVVLLAGGFLGWWREVCIYVSVAGHKR